MFLEYKLEATKVFFFFKSKSEPMFDRNFVFFSVKKNQQQPKNGKVGMS
jgi:hypothetical protein